MPDVGTNAGKVLGANIAAGVGNPGKKIGKELESGVADGADGAAGQVKARLSERLGAQVGSVIGKGIGGGISAGLKVGELALKGALIGAAGAATAVVGGVGLALTKGFDRLKSIDEATFKLKALGHSAGETKVIMDSALASVKGTAFSLGDAATAAASAVAAGIKPGQDLTKYLTDVGDAAAVAGTNFEDMGSIFNKIQTQNKAYTDDLQQLSDRGLPIFTWLQQEYGVTGEALTKMVQGGQVDAAHFQDAIEKHIGGAAKTMGQSFAGSVDNAEAALGRLGAAFLAPIFGNAAGGVAGITAGLDNMTAWVNAHKPEIINFFTDIGVAAVNIAQDAVKSFGQIIGAVGDFTHGLGTAVSLFDSDKGQKLQAVGDALNGIGDNLIKTAAGFDTWNEKVRAWGAAASEAAANMQGASGAVTGLGTAVGALPFKHVIDVNADTKDSKDRVIGLGNAVAALQDKTISVNVKGQLSVSGTGSADNSVLNSFDGVTVKPGSIFGVDGPLANNPLIVGSQNTPSQADNKPLPQNPIRLVPRRALGGSISGPGGPKSDIIPIWASNGEFIVNAASARKNMALLNAINSDKLLGYAGGGSVGPDVDAAGKLVGTPYSQDVRTDCSGMVARIINAALGMGGDLMTTKTAQSWLSKRGFVNGLGGPGAISVGWYDHGPNPNDGHMAMTLSDGSNAEAGGSHNNFLVGGQAAGASNPEFDHHMYLQLAAKRGSAVTGQGDSPQDDSAAPLASDASSSAAGASFPSSLSGLSSFGLSGLGAGVGTTGSGSDLSLFGNAAASAVSGQVASLAGVFGAGDNPPFLQAASQLLGGIKIGGQGSGGSSAAPLSARSTATGTPPPDDAGNVHGTRAGQAPGPQVVYNIRTATTEDAFVRANRIENERALAKLSVY